MSDLILVFPPLFLGFFGILKPVYKFRELIRDKQFLHATAVLIGTMVGVGVFGIPFTFAKAGFWVGTLFLVAIAGITILFNLIFAEIVLRTEGKHQLVGYTNIYLGPWFKRIVLFTNLLGIYGALLAYIIVAGDFLNNILSQFFYLQPTAYSFIFFAFIAAILPFGFRTIAWVEFSLTSLFIVVIFIISGFGVPNIQWPNLITSGDPHFWFLPYGVLLFAFAGLTSIPIQREVIRGKEHRMKPSILYAVFLVGILYLLFAFIVVGVSGDVTSPDALAGLFDFLGTKVVILGSLLGVLTISTSSLMLGTALRDIFRLDYGLNKRWSWFLVVVPPILMFIGGLRTFIDVIGLVGSVAIGIESAILVFVYKAARRDGSREPEFKLSLPGWLLMLMVFMFTVGVIYEVFIS